MAEAMSEAEILKDLEAFDKEPLKIGTRIVEPKQSFQEQARQAVAADLAEQKAQEKPPVQEQKEVESAPSEEKPEPEEQKTEESPASERQRDEKGRFAKASDRKEEVPPTTEAVPSLGTVPEPPPTAERTDTKSQTEYEKAKERKDRSWKALEEEKRQEREFAKRERELLARERELFNQERRQQLAQGPKSDVIGYDHAGKEIYSSASLWKAALDFERDGRDDMAKMARDAIPASQRYEVQQAQQVFEANRNRIIQDVLREQPALGDQNSPEYREMASIYDAEAERARQHGRRPLFDLIPDFMPYAAEHAKLRLEVAALADKDKRIAELEGEIRRLLGQRQVNGSTPTTPPPPVEWKDLGTDKQLEMMDAAMSQARRQAGYRG